jgi:Mg2+/Co2+ transporter CorB
VNYYLILFLVIVLFFIEIILYLGDGAILSSSVSILYSKYKNTKSSKKIMELKDNATKITGVIIILTNISHQIITILCSVLFLHYFGYKGLAYCSLGLGIFYAYFEIFLKITSVEYPEQIVYFLSDILYSIYKLLCPISNFMERFIFLQLKLLGVKKKNGHDPVQEIRGAIGYHLDKIDQDHAHILKNAANLNNWSVLEIMKHRKNLITIGVEESFDNLINIIRNTGQEYIPVWQGTEEDIIGFIDSHFFLKTIVLEDYNAEKTKLESIIKERKIKDYIQQPTFIYKRMTISKFLQMLNSQEDSPKKRNGTLNQSIHRQDKIFLVVEEDGSFVGLVNRDNLSDAIIKNTNCSNITNIRKYKEGYIVPGGTTINNINFLLGFDLDASHITITNLFLNHYRNASNKINYVEVGKYKIILLSKPTTSKMFFYIEEKKT